MGKSFFVVVMNDSMVYDMVDGDGIMHMIDCSAHMMAVDNEDQN